MGSCWGHLSGEINRFDRDMYYHGDMMGKQPLIYCNKVSEWVDVSERFEDTLINFGE